MAADNLYDQAKEFLSALQAQLTAAKADGKLTLSEIFQLVTGSVSFLVKAVNGLDIAGADKKALVVNAIQKLYDEVIAPIDIPGIPNILETTIVDPAVGKAIPYVVDGLIEFFVRQLKQA